MKLEVGMYVRNDTFGIFQISKIEMIPVDNQLGDGNRYKLTLFKNDKDGISFYYIKPVDDLSNSLTSSFNLIDLIEENNGKLNAFEFKYSDKKVNVPNSWITNYPDSIFKTVNKENYLDFVR